MILYHWSSEKGLPITFDESKPHKDFNTGIYLTEDREYATMMAQREAAIFGGNPIVTSMLFDEEALMASSTITVKYFDMPNREWMEFVVANRQEGKYTLPHNYDVLIGSVVSEAAALFIRRYLNGEIDMTTLVDKVKYKQVPIQYVFRTLRSTQYLRVL